MIAISSECSFSGTLNLFNVSTKCWATILDRWTMSWLNSASLLGGAVSTWIGQLTPYRNAIAGSPMNQVVAELVEGQVRSAATAEEVKVGGRVTAVWQ